MIFVIGVEKCIVRMPFAVLFGEGLPLQGRLLSLPYGKGFGFARKVSKKPSPQGRVKTLPYLGLCLLPFLSENAGHREGANATVAISDPLSMPIRREIATPLWGSQ